jgi:hypothetical protein
MLTTALNVRVFQTMDTRSNRALGRATRHSRR